MHCVTESKITHTCHPGGYCLAQVADAMRQTSEVTELCRILILNDYNYRLETGVLSHLGQDGFQLGGG